jgi:preprotein translocase subunit SecY
VLSQQERLQGPGSAEQDPVHLFMVAVYRLGSPHPGAGHRPGSSNGSRTQAEPGWRARLPPAVLGRRVHQFAIFALGIMPYITASIIMQILGVVIPKLEEWQQQGAVGPAQDHPVDPLPRHRHRRAAGHRLHVPLPQRWRRRSSARRQTVPEHRPAAGRPVAAGYLVVLTLVAGTALLMWMGELITQRGIGNGMSMLIFASVVSQPARQFYGRSSRRAGSPFVRSWWPRRRVHGRHRLHRAGQRRIPVQFAKRVRSAAACTAARAPTSR